MTALTAFGIFAGGYFLGSLRHPANAPIGGETSGR
jgi:hypothetical protein